MCKQNYACAMLQLRIQVNRCKVEVEIYRQNCTYNPNFLLGFSVTENRFEGQGQQKKIEIYMQNYMFQTCRQNDYVTGRNQIHEGVRQLLAKTLTFLLRVLFLVRFILLLNSLTIHIYMYIQINNACFSFFKHLVAFLMFACL